MGGISKRKNTGTFFSPIECVKKIRNKNKNGAFKFPQKVFDLTWNVPKCIFPEVGLMFGTTLLPICRPNHLTNIKQDL